MKVIFKIILIFIPWSVRRVILQKVFKYEIHPSAKIGFSFIYPKHLTMNEGAVIGNLTVAINLEKIEIGNNSIIGRNNWITGFPKTYNSRHFSHQKDRIANLKIGKHSAITKNHHIDCTNSIVIGDFVTIAGYQSQFLTHSIDVMENIQDSKPIEIGDYCFIGTNVVVLGGAILPSHSVLGAKSLLNKKFDKEWTLYAGVAAKPVKEIPKNGKYFIRETGFVN